MFSIFKCFLLPIIFSTTFPSSYLSLNITEMNVPSVVIAPEKASLSCTKEADKENDQFQYLEWSKLVDGKWRVFHKMPPISTAENSNSTSEVGPVLFKLEDMSEPTEDGTVGFTKTSLSTQGWYKCSVKSTSGLVEKVMELRVIYTPEEASTPVISYKVEDNYITVTCSAPASYPGTALRFFVNYELPAPGEVRDLSPVRVRNTSYGESVELPINVVELKIRPKQEYILNGKLQVVCTATFANVYHKFIQSDILYDGPIYDKKCLTGAIIALIVVSVLVFVILIALIVWCVIRKKKVNSLNKVAELFNRQKSVLVDKE